MRTFFIVLGIWLLINVLFVVIMIPPRKPRTSSGQNGSGSLSPVLIKSAHPPEEEDGPFSLRHAIIALALGVFFSLTPPLLEAYDAIKTFVRKRRAGEGASYELSASDQSRESSTSELNSNERP